MDIKTAIKVLHDTQKWRRGYGDEMPHTPKVFGEAIDIAIRNLRQIERNNEDIRV
jgi:hypothetical protein